MKLGFDVDGVFTNIATRMVKVSQEKLGKSISLSSIYKPDLHGLSREELDYIFSPDFFYDMEPLEENIEATQQLVEDGHEIHVVTARPESNEMFDATIEWFKKHGVPQADSFTFHHDKALVAYHLQLKRFVEDFSSNANSLAQMMSEVYLVNQPYNAEDVLESNVVRVNSVWDVRFKLRKELLASAA
jgi:uncharacterized HAD superfamily protein